LKINNKALDIAASPFKVWLEYHNKLIGYIVNNAKILLNYCWYIENFPGPYHEGISEEQSSIYTHNKSLHHMGTNGQL
jgi:hypothetical protein